MNSEKNSIIKLKINYTESFFYLLIYSLLFSFVWWLVIFQVKHWVGILIFSPILFVGSIDLIILISHILNAFKRTIYWDKESEIIIVRRLFKKFEIKLNSTTTSIVSFYPPIQGSAGKGFPGFGFDVLKICQNDKSVKISNLEYFDYDLKSKLVNHKNYSEKKRQFNIIF